MTAPATFGTREPGVIYRPRPAAYAVILDGEGRVACVTEASGLYLPGGGIEPGEDAARALRREVSEECAREVEILAALGEAIQYYRSARGEAFELRAWFFNARFGHALDVAPAHELSWWPAMPEPPPLFHACHRWAVHRATARDGLPPLDPPRTPS